MVRIIIKEQKWKQVIQIGTKREVDIEFKETKTLRNFHLRIV